MNNSDIFSGIYLIATLLFIYGLKGLSSPKTARAGNISAMIGMTIATVITLLHPDLSGYSWIALGLFGGALIGISIAVKIPMTSMPELVAILHSFVGLAAVLIGIGFLHSKGVENITTSLGLEIGLGVIIGAITFTGSVLAFGKLKGTIKSAPLLLPGRHLINIGLAVFCLILLIQFVFEPSHIALILMAILASILGVLLVIPIGGADMPVVVSMLNSYSGWAASATGFTLQNQLLIATGALVGSSGAILSYIMCKAMNRSFISVILGGFGDTNAVMKDDRGGKVVQSASPEDVSFMMANAQKVIFVPGYGMAVAQAQHSIKELYELLIEKGVEVKFAIHPVAGRMPGHMNVLLAEADIPYDCVFEMEDINSEFSTADVAFVVGANDIVNPAAKTDSTSPLYGMPILEAFKSKQIFISKRSMGVGYAGVDNPLFFYNNASLVFGDAKATCEAILSGVRDC